MAILISCLDDAMAFSSPFYRWRPHPWHGISPGPQAAEGTVQAYIEMTPFDLIKYEVDKTTGYLRVDRPQRSSSLPPTLYGFVPQTYCGPRVSRLSPTSLKGDHDPVDICVLSERPVARAELILTARIVGGIQMVDNREADDKLIAVLANDALWSSAQDIGDLPSSLVDRLRHYFSTYKLVPDEPSRISVESIYGFDHAIEVLRAALDDYDEMYGRE